MMDTETKRSDLMEIHNRSCADCHTTRTPLWRGGPAGPRSLCNACGIRYRKKRRAVLLGLNKERTKKSSSSSKSRNSKHGVSFKLGEEEQAAILLMALSCGSFYV